jgi:aldehyde dehydrogenase (NAD+)
VLAGHDDVDGLWCFAADDLGRDVERLAAGNMKRTWLAPGRDWWDARQAEGPEFLRHAAEIKNIWVPYGE